MAGYFLSNNRNIIPTIRRASKEIFSKFQTFNLGAFVLVLYQKINIEGHRNYYSQDGDFIAGTGTYLYKRKMGTNALPEIMKDFLSNRFVFDQVIGHFTFIIFSQNKLFLVTDKSGHLFTLEATKGKFQSYSSSFSLLCHSLENLTLQKQEILEYINTAAVYGGKTFCSEINHAISGQVYNLSQNNRESYIDDRIFLTKNANELLGDIKKYFSQFSHAQLSAGCDISSGYDTRTILASLLDAGIDTGLVCNDRPRNISPDAQIADQISKYFKKELHLIPLEYSRLTEGGLSLSEMMQQSEFSRGVDISKRFMNEVGNKSEIFPLMFSGWGAEMLRNQFGKSSNIVDLVKGYGYSRIQLRSDKEMDVYVQNIIKKMKRTQIEWSSSMFMDPVEIAYYFEKGRYWAGSSLTVRNKYAYWLFPFHDFTLAKSVLGFKRRNQKLQSTVIKTLNHDLSRFPYGSSDILIRNKMDKIGKNIVRTFKKIKRKLVKNKQLESADYSDGYRGTDDTFIGEITGVDRKFLRKNNNIREIAKLDTINEFYHLHREKIEI